MSHSLGSNGGARNEARTWPMPRLPAIGSDMQRALNLAYFRFGRAVVLRDFRWEMDEASREALAIHMGSAEAPTQCAGLPVVRSDAPGWRLRRD